MPCVGVVHASDLPTEDLKASSVDKNDNKPKNEDQGKKKKKRSRALKITNTHMKAFVSRLLAILLQQRS